MRPPIIINESSNPMQPGCIYLFSSVALAERYFEAWYADESYYACDVDGQPLNIQPDQVTGNVEITECQGKPARPDLVISFLREYIVWLMSSNKIQASEAFDTWLRSASVEEMAEVSLPYATE